MGTGATVAGIALAGVLAVAGCGGVDGASDKSTAATDGTSTGRVSMTARGDGPEVGSGAPPADLAADSVSPSGDKAVAPAAPTGLRAGSVDDNEHWEDFLLYRQDFLTRGIAAHDVDVTGRRVVTVEREQGQRVFGADVRLFSGATEVARARTHADGRAFLFPRGIPASDGQQGGPALRVVVQKDGRTTEKALGGEREISVTLDAPHARGISLDVVFVIDATGSMSDEIEQLKANVISISDRISQLPAKPNLRFGMTVFRDRGDAFVTRNFDLTGDVGAFKAAMRDVSADGGGDGPESVNAAVHDAVRTPTWRGRDTVKLAFLVGDAAPHLDYADDADYVVEAFEAAALGIKIHPVASSGLDDQGEYVFRQLALLTGGRFTFLTYGAGGAPQPGDSTAHHVKDYSVLSLDDLVVQLVSDELAPLVG